MLHWQKQLKLGRQLVFAIEAVRKVDAPHAAVGVNLHAQRFYVVCAISAAREVGEVELDLVPALIQSHRHSADERFDACGGLHGWVREWRHQRGKNGGADLVVGCSEATADVLIVQYLNLESEVLLKIFDDHDQKRQLDAESLLRVGRARDEVGAHLSARVRNSDDK